MTCFFVYNIFTTIDFSGKIGYHKNKSESVFYHLEVFCLKKSNKFAILVGIISAAAAVAAAVAAILLFLEKKKKDEEELEHYLDCSIQ